VLSLFAYLALALLFVAGVYANGTLLRAYLKKEKYENPFSYAAPPSSFSILPFPSSSVIVVDELHLWSIHRAKLKNPYVLTEADIKPHVDAFVGVANDFIHLTRHAIYFTDTVFSVKVRATTGPFPSVPV
jgi:hypothetical protein